MAAKYPTYRINEAFRWYQGFGMTQTILPTGNGLSNTGNPIRY